MASSALVAALGGQLPADATTGAASCSPTEVAEEELFSINADLLSNASTATPGRQWLPSPKPSPKVERRACLTEWYSLATLPPTPDANAGLVDHLHMELATRENQLQRACGEIANLSAATRMSNEELRCGNAMISKLQEEACSREQKLRSVEAELEHLKARRSLMEVPPRLVGAARAAVRPRRGSAPAGGDLGRPVQVSRTEQGACCQAELQEATATVARLKAALLHRDQQLLASTAEIEFMHAELESYSAGASSGSKASDRALGAELGPARSRRRSAPTPNSSQQLGEAELLQLREEVRRLDEELRCGDAELAALSSAVMGEASCGGHAAASSEPCSRGGGLLGTASAEQHKADAIDAKQSHRLGLRRSIHDTHLALLRRTRIEKAYELCCMRQVIAFLRCEAARRQAASNWHLHARQRAPQPMP